MQIAATGPLQIGPSSLQLRYSLKSKSYQCGSNSQSTCDPPIAQNRDATLSPLFRESARPRRFSGRGVSQPEGNVRTNQANSALRQKGRKQPAERATDAVIGSSPHAQDTFAPDSFVLPAASIANFERCP